MKKILSLLLVGLFITTNCFAVDITDWRRGSSTAPVVGTENISDLDVNTENYGFLPLDRLLTNYRTGCQLAYTSATTVTIQAGEIVCSNAGGTIRRMRKNTATTTVVMTTAGVGGLDTGAEANSTTYYVYAVADADATTFTAVCSTSATTPTGFTYYRYIGNFYNNSGGDIDSTKVVGVGAGRVVQVVNYQTGAVATGTTQMVNDDSIPQNTEGDEYMTLAITPKSATNKLKIDVVIHLGDSVAAIPMIVALFQDATAGALAASLSFTYGYVDETQPIKFTHYMTSGTTSATTFKVRAGTHGASTVTINGLSAGRKLGGVMASSITVTEVAS